MSGENLTEYWIRYSRDYALAVIQVYAKYLVWIWNEPKPPVELGEYERRFSDDPYCARWCPYSCNHAWRQGKCLIRTPEANKAFLLLAYPSLPEECQICGANCGPLERAWCFAEWES